MVKVFSLYFTPGSYADAIAIQAVADALNLIIYIIEANPGFLHRLLISVQFAQKLILLL